MILYWVDVAGVSVGVVFDVAVGVDFDVAVGVDFDVAVGVAFDVAVGVADDVAVGAAVGVLFDVVFGVTFDVTVGVDLDVAVGVAPVAAVDVEFATLSTVEDALGSRINGSRMIFAIPSKTSRKAVETKSDELRVTAPFGHWTWILPVW